jgi:hypothetical protein
VDEALVRPECEAAVRVFRRDLQIEFPNAGQDPSDARRRPRGPPTIV